MNRLGLLALATVLVAIISGCAATLGENLTKESAYGEIPKDGSVKKIFVEFNPENYSSGFGLNIFKILPSDSHDKVKAHIQKTVADCYKKGRISIVDSKESADVTLKITAVEAIYGAMKEDNQGAKIAGQILGTIAGGAVGLNSMGSLGAGKALGSAADKAANRPANTTKMFFHVSQDISQPGTEARNFNDMLYFGRSATSKYYTGYRLEKDWYKQLDSVINFTCPF